MKRKGEAYVCLYDYVTQCNCPKKDSCGQLHVPVFTGIPVQPTWPPSEDFARGQLMMFSKTIWKKVEDLLGDYETYASAFADFLESPDCPTSVKFILRMEKQKYDTSHCHC